MERHNLKRQILGTQMTQSVQNVTLSVSLERKFLEVRPRIRLNSASSVQCSMAPMSEEKKMKQYHRGNGSMEKFDAQLPAQDPASSGAKISTVGLEDKSEEGAVPGQEDGKY